jgi:phenylalanyl-tRNA synthetase beta chain
MNVSYRWLRTLAPDLSLAPGPLAEELASLGFPVEAMEALGEGMDGLVVGRVLEVREHPNADRLRLCMVDPGEGDPLQVVCGAPQIQEGGLYPFAPVGSTLPGGMELRKARIRGETSHGMLCSEAELELGDDAGGILLLEGDFEPGQALAQALGLDDVRMDVEVTSNRPDLLSHRGIAREVAPQGVKSVQLPEIPGATKNLLPALERVTGEQEAQGEELTVRIESPDRCSAYLGLVLRDVEVGPSPPWLQRRLRAAGARPINNVVDATNYVLLELGHPLHAFDLDRIQDGTIVVRQAREGEGIRTLDGEDRKLTAQDLVISDPDQAVAIAGVMGGMNSEVGDETRNLLLECALFTPGAIRTTRKRLGLSTDASYRFERGVDPEGLLEAIERTAQVILATGGGRVDGPVVEAQPVPFERQTVQLRRERVEAVLGISFTGDRIEELLRPLGFETLDRSGDRLNIQIPGYRSWDVSREVDLIEEVARTHGYNAFPAELSGHRPGTVPDHPLFILEDRLRDHLTRRGLLEGHTLAFAAKGEVALANPISAREGFLRRDLLPGLLGRVEYNLARGNRNVRLFEIGTVFRRGEVGGLPREDTSLAMVLHGEREPEHWSGQGTPLDPWDLKGMMEEILAVIDEPGLRLVPAKGDSSGAGLDPHVRFQVMDRDGNIRGECGRVLPADMDLPPWAGNVWGAELHLPANPRTARAHQYQALPTRPGIERDLSLLIPTGDPVADLVSRIQRTGGSELKEVGVFDVYEGEGIPEGTRSVAIRLHFRAEERTLTDAEVDREMDQLTQMLREELGVGIRGQGD